MRPTARELWLASIEPLPDGVPEPSEIGTRVLAWLHHAGGTEEPRTLLIEAWLENELLRTRCRLSMLVVEHDRQIAQLHESYGKRIRDLERQVARRGG